MSEPPSILTKVEDAPLLPGQMSKWSVNLRALLYIGIAIVTQAQTDLASMFSTDPQTQAKFWLGITLAGMITYRAYIDSSNANKAP